MFGWRIASNEADTIPFEAQSSLITAWPLLRVSGSTAVLTTNVEYAGWMGRSLWAAVSPIHRRAIPYLLGCGASALHTAIGDSASR
jgi:hypothetical protein